MKTGRVLHDTSPRPDLSRFVDGPTDAIAWRGDQPLVSQHPPTAVQGTPPRPDLSRFVDGPTDAIAWAWDEEEITLAEATLSGVRTGHLAGATAPVMTIDPSAIDRVSTGALLTSPPAQADLWEMEKDLPVSISDFLCPGSSRHFALEQQFAPPAPAVDAECRQELRHLEDNEPLCAVPFVNVRATDEEDCDCSYDMIYFALDTEIYLHDEEYRATIPDFERSNPIIHGYAIGNDQGAGDSKEEVLATSLDVKFLLAIWNFLVANIDIVEWVICLVEGPNNARCIGDKLRGLRKQKIALANSLPFGCGTGDSIACTTFIGNKITINITSWRWTNGRDNYFDDLGTGSSLLCVIVDWAAFCSMNCCTAVWRYSPKVLMM